MREIGVVVHHTHIPPKIMAAHLDVPLFLTTGHSFLAVGGVALEGGGGEANCTCRCTAEVVTAGVFGDAVALVAVATASLAAAVGCGVPGDLRIRDVVAARLNVLAIP